MLRAGGPDGTRAAGPAAGIARGGAGRRGRPATAAVRCGSIPACASVFPPGGCEVVVRHVTAATRRRPSATGGRPLAHWAAVAAAVLTLLPPGARAQLRPDAAGSAPTVAAADAPGPAPKPATTLADVTVEAARKSIQHRVDSFIWQLTRRAREALARWNTPACPMVAGLSREQGEFVLGRFSQVAAAAGAPLAAPQCRPNLYIVVTRSPEALLTAWHARDARLFGEGYPHAIRRFVDTPRPVRVWYNGDYESGPPAGTAASAEAATIAGYEGLRVDVSAKPTRLQWNAVRDLGSVIVIVEPTRTRGVPLAQLADYIALVALAEIDLDAPLGEAPTILHLFGADAPPATAPVGLSDWDAAFLKALYHTDPRDTMQRAAMQQQVLHDVAP
jgi:hypothetical protein